VVQSPARVASRGSRDRASPAARPSPEPAASSHITPYQKPAVQLPWSYTSCRQALRRSIPSSRQEPPSVKCGKSRSERVSPARRSRSAAAR